MRDEIKIVRRAYKKANRRAVRGKPNTNKNESGESWRDRATRLRYRLTWLLRHGDD